MDESRGVADNTRKRARADVHQSWSNEIHSSNGETVRDGDVGDLHPVS